MFAGKGNFDAPLVSWSGGSSSWDGVGRLVNKEPEGGSVYPGRAHQRQPEAESPGYAASCGPLPGSEPDRPSSCGLGPISSNLLPLLSHRQWDTPTPQHPPCCPWGSEGFVFQYLWPESCADLRACRSLPSPFSPCYMPILGSE